MEHRVGPRFLAVVSSFYRNHYTQTEFRTKDKCRNLKGVSPAGSRRWGMDSSFCTLRVEVSHVVDMSVTVVWQCISRRKPRTRNWLKIRSNNTIRGQDAERSGCLIITHSGTR